MAGSVVRQRAHSVPCRYGYVTITNIKFIVVMDDAEVKDAEVTKVRVSPVPLRVPPVPLHALSLFV